MANVASETQIAERFAVWLSKTTGQSHTVSRSCNPPDFLLTSVTWLEVSNIYLSNEQAKFLNLRGGKEFSLSGSPDESARRLLKQLDEKLAKTSYRAIYQERGQGILLLTCQDFFFDEGNLARVREKLHSFTPSDDQHFFSAAYFEYGLPTRERVYEVIYPRISQQLNHVLHPMHVYEVRPRRDKRGVDLISDVLPFGALWYGNSDAIANAISYAKFRSRSHDAVIRVYDECAEKLQNSAVGV